DEAQSLCRMRVEQSLEVCNAARLPHKWEALVLTENEHKALGKWMREYRKVLGLSQDEIKKSHPDGYEVILTSTISRVEVGDLHLGNVSWLGFCSLRGVIPPLLRKKGFSEEDLLPLEEWKKIKEPDIEPNSYLYPYFRPTEENEEERRRVFDVRCAHR